MWLHKTTLCKYQTGSYIYLSKCVNNSQLDSYTQMRVHMHMRLLMQRAGLLNSYSIEFIVAREH